MTADFSGTKNQGHNASQFMRTDYGQTWLTLSAFHFHCMTSHDLRYFSWSWLYVSNLSMSLSTPHYVSLCVMRWLPLWSSAPVIKPLHTRILLLKGHCGIWQGIWCLSHSCCFSFISYNFQSAFLTLSDINSHLLDPVQHPVLTPHSLYKSLHCFPLSALWLYTCISHYSGCTTTINECLNHQSGQIILTLMSLPMEQVIRPNKNEKYS